MSSRITFQPKSHRYALDGTRVPSVTTIIGNSTPKIGLRYWYAREAAHWAANNIDLLQTTDVDAWIKQAAGAADSNRDRKAERGKSVHQHAHDLLEGQADVPPDQVKIVEQAARFLERWGVDEIASERPCANTELRYAGTFDLLARLRGNVLWLLDYKTGDNLYPEHGLQLAAYAGCDIYQRDEETDVPFPEVDALGIVHLSNDGWNLIPVAAERSKLFDYFRLMRYVSDYTSATSGYPNPRWSVIGDPLPKPDLDVAS